MFDNTMWDGSSAMVDRPRASERRAAGKGPRTSLTLEAIIDRACQLLDAEGLEALTLRRLAGELGVGAASVYWYVDGKDELIELCFNATLEKVVTDLLGRRFEAASWKADLRTMFSDLFDLLTRHQWVAQLISSQQSRGRLVMLVWDRVGVLLGSVGLSVEESFYAGSALMGHLGAMSLVSASQRIPGTDPDADREVRLQRIAADIAALDPEVFPGISLSIPVLLRHTEREQFLGGLDLILDGIASRLPSA